MQNRHRRDSWITIMRQLIPIAASAAIAFVAASAAAQNNDALGAQGLSDTEVEAIQSLILTQTEYLEDRNITAYANTFTETAVLMPVDHPRVVGRDNIVSFVEQNMSDGVEVTYSDWDVAGREDLAVVTNNVTISSNRSGAIPKAIDQIVVLRFHEEEGWQVQAAIWAVP